MSDVSSFQCLRRFFLLLRFFFFDLESDENNFDDESEDDVSWSRFTRESESGLSGSCPFYFLKIPLIVFVDFHVMESQNSFVMSVEYFQSEYFPAQKLVYFQVQNS